MAWTGYQKFLALMMVVTGSINTLSTKWADKVESKGSDGVVRVFEHPFLQAAAMFLGEMMCLFVFKLIYFKTRNTGGHQLTQGNQSFNPFILMPAAMFDLVGTSIMYVGLTLTYASSFQMFRGSVIIFVAAFSTIFLDKQIIKREWAGIAGVILGLVIVGSTDAIFREPGETKGPNSLITGDLLIIVAQVITSCQMVYEEKYVTGLNIPPLQAVGWEGVFGFSVLSALLVVFYWTPAPPHFGHNARGTVEDAIDGLVQIGNNPVLLVAILGTIVSIAFFNFAGISVTKEMSATTRMVLDSVREGMRKLRHGVGRSGYIDASGIYRSTVALLSHTKILDVFRKYNMNFIGRTLVIWMVSLAVRWQVFHWPHLLGFAVLIYGMAEYNALVPRCRRAPAAAPEPATAAADADQEEA